MRPLPSPGDTIVCCSNGFLEYELTTGKSYVVIETAEEAIEAHKEYLRILYADDPERLEKMLAIRWVSVIDDQGQPNSFNFDLSFGGYRES